MPIGTSSTAEFLFDIGSIAVIGASEDQSKFGGRLFSNLLRHGFKGDIYPINAGRTELFGKKTFPDLASLPAVPDAFVLALPAHLVKDQVKVAAKMGIRLGIVISAGFSDAGDAGRQLEQELVEIARSSGMRLIGPNCLGLISPEKGIVLCSSPVLDRATLPKQPVGLVSQSGALMTTLFDKAWSQGGGFSHGFSVGNQADLEVCDFIDYMVADDATRVICAYIEGVKDAERFLACARRAREAGKPLLIVKAGRSKAGQEAAFSHTASVAGDAAVFEAACREQGALVIDDVNIMLSVAAYMATQTPRPLNHIAIVSPSGGGGALAADAISEAGLELATLGERAQAILADHYPAEQIKIPLDFGTHTGRDTAASAQAAALAVQQENTVDAVLCVTAMAPVPWQLQVVESQIEQSRTHRKPVIVAIDAGHTSDPVRQLLQERGMPYTNSTADAVRTLAYARKWQQLELVGSEARPSACPGAPQAMPAGQYDEHQTKALLAAYGIPANAGRITASAEEAVAAADALGYPVVLKIVSADIVHKSDAGGVIVGINTPQELRDACQTMLRTVAERQPQAHIEGMLVQRMLHGQLEVIVGGRNDATFGPTVLFGAGGVLVELLPDKFLASAPATPETVRQGLNTLTIGKMLEGYRGQPLAKDALVDIIVRLSWLMHDLKDQPFEIDLNPVLVGSDHATAVDARLLVG